MDKIIFDTFDIIGPIMIGPSSSHTAGAVRIGLMAGQLCKYDPIEIEIMFHGSLANTYSFHKTDVAVLAGVMGLKADDSRIKDSIVIAKDRGIKINFGTIKIEGAHPSTIIIKLKDNHNKEFNVRSATVGGGNILIEEVNGIKLKSNGKQHNLLIKLNSNETNKLESIIKKDISSDYRIVTYDSSSYIEVVCKERISERQIKDYERMSVVEEVYYFEPIMPESKNLMAPFKSIKEIVEYAKRNNSSISDTVIEYECNNSGRDKEEVISEMRDNYMAMKAAIKNGNENESIMLANIFKGNAKKMNNFIENGRSICGVSLSKVIRNALAVMEVNGSMGKVVACPTAGSAGTLPSAVITIAEENNIDDEKVVKALFTGAGIGMIIARNATISGSVGGCQAECGVASAMSAAIITEIFGGEYDQITSSSSIALGNILGLVCDPVAGTVELPCIQRNVMAAANAIVSAEMALSGMDSIIPLDEMIGALKEVGDLMDDSLKDTLGAGISNTPTARKLEAKLFKN